MIMKKHVLVAVLATFCMTFVLFGISPTRSANNPYDPWLDTNGDGRIDMRDIGAECTSFGETGDPSKNVNVTNFPLDEQGNLRFATVHSTMNKTLALNRSIANGERHNYTESVIGYRAVDVSCNSTIGGISVDLIWIVGGIEVMYTSIGGHAALYKMDVYGESIKLSVRCDSSSDVYSVGLWATD